MKQATSKKLFDYWNKVRGSRRAPRRFEVEPSHISDILPETFVAEDCQGGSICFRLAGTRITLNIGRELKGVNLFSFFNAADQEALKNLFHTISEDASVGVVSFSAESASGVRIGFEMTILPLVHKQDRINRFLGNITPVALSPHLGMSRLTNFELGDVDLVWPDVFPAFMLEDSLVPEPEAVTQGYTRIVRSERRCFRVYDGGLAEN